MIALSEGQCAVYRLSFPSGKEYIGVTTDPKRRLTEHERAKTLVGSAIRKHGFPAVQILAICTEDYAYELERKAVRGLDTLVPAGYNLVEGGIGSSAGREASVATREKMSKAQKGHSCSEETRRKLVESHRGKRLSVETKAKMSAAAKGKRKSAEHRANISKAKMGVKCGPLSAEHRRKISEANRGRKGTTQGPLSAEHRVNISEAIKDHWVQCKVKQKG